jgi:transcriptional regulator with XRE-family HTH domain
VTTIEEPTRSLTAATTAVPVPEPGSAADSAAGGRRGERRAELSAFLRARRSRIRPAEVGLPPGFRRRTPGLRREEVAQLAGVGVTWYTWLEQGRRIHVSAQVLTAIARTLRLDDAEREHLFRLAGTPTVPMATEDEAVPGEVLEILAALAPLPACLLNSRYDILADNAGYQALFRDWHTVPCERANVLWCCCTEPAARERYVNLDEQLPRLVGTLRAAFAHHLGEPAWTDFIRQLSLASPEFARLWARHDVARPATMIKRFRHPDAGVLTMSSTSLAIAGLPETRIVTYTPTDDHTRAWLERAMG